MKIVELGGGMSEKSIHRPLPVWIVLVFFVLYPIGAYFFVASMLRGDPALAPFVGPLMVARIMPGFALFCFVNLAAAVALFFLSRFAFYLFLIPGAIALEPVLIVPMHEGPVDLPTLAGKLTAAILQIAICAYAWRLKKNGVLS